MEIVEREILKKIKRTEVLIERISIMGVFRTVAGQEVCIETPEFMTGHEYIWIFPDLSILFRRGKRGLKKGPLIMNRLAKCNCESVSGSRLRQRT